MSEAVAVEKKHVQKYKKKMRWHMIGGLCLLNGYRLGAEIGVSTGRFSVYLCGVDPDMHMLAVDEWIERPDNTAPGQQTYVGWNNELWMQRLKRISAVLFQNRITVRRMDSVKAANTVIDDALDFVFIDADHSYAGCKADIAAWAPKVRKGGMVSGHDYNDAWPGVKEAVNELGQRITVLPDSVWFYTK